MKIRRHEPLLAHRGIGLLAITMILFMALAGCSGPSHLKKKVGLANFTNRTRLESTDFQQAFNNAFFTRVDAECSHSILIKPNDLDAPGFLSELPRNKYNDVDHYLLSQVGRQLGFNTIVTGSFIAIKADEVKKGYLWFEKSLPVALINISVEIYDTTTAAKLIDENFTKKIKVDEEELASIKENKLSYSDVTKRAVIDLAKDIADEVCDVISDQPWKGFVVSVSDNHVVLSAGSNNKLAVGDILEVYDDTRTVEGFNRHVFFLPGKKTGELKITAVSPDRSEADIIAGEAIKPGFTVIFK